MHEIDLVPFDGTNPICFLAALGVLGVLTRDGRDATLRWTDELVPHAVVTGAASIDELVMVVDADRGRWQRSAVLDWPPGTPLEHARPGPDELRAWTAAVLEVATQRPWDAELFSALVAEGGLGRSGKAKPTHFDFTAGQQRFLRDARTLRDGLTPELIRNALFGPWEPIDRLPLLRWDLAGDRPYAVAATDPSKRSPAGVPAMIWLAFLGLACYPVVGIDSGVHTTACDREWKRSAFRWPLWSGPLDWDTAGALVADRSVVGPRADLNTARLARRGVHRVLEAPIRRTDQGGYGSFGTALTLAEAAR